jgi:hypothetical protein
MAGRIRHWVKQPFVRYRYLTPPQRRRYWRRVRDSLLRVLAIVGLIYLMILPHTGFLEGLQVNCGAASSEAYCIGSVCFEHPNPSGSYQEIFGFEEYLAALALFVVLYTTAEFRFKFRISVAPSRLRRNTFALLIVIGLGAIVAETWTAEAWPTPRFCGLNRHTWQLALGVAFFLSLLTWLYYAFIRPTLFSHRNASFFYNEVYSILRRGNEQELAELGDELARSARRIVETASELGPTAESSSIASLYAHDILLIIADRKFCRQIVRTSPGTAYAFFSALDSANGQVPRAIGPFSQALSAEAIINQESFVYRETEPYPVGGLAKIYPVTDVLYGDFRAIHTLSPYSAVDLRYDEYSRWRAKEWGAFCRVILITFRSYVRSSPGSHPAPLFGAIHQLESAMFEIAKAENYSGVQSEGSERVGAIVTFIKRVFEEIDEAGTLNDLLGGPGNDLIINIAELCANLIMHAGRVEGTQQTLWWIHHNMIWGELVERFGHNESPAHRAFLARLFKELKSEIWKLSEFPNYKGAPMLGFLLHVLNVEGDIPQEGYRAESRQLTRWVRQWVQKHFWSVYLADRDVAQAAMIGPLSLDLERGRIVYTHHGRLPTRAVVYELQLDVTGAASVPASRTGTPYQPRWKRAKKPRE